MVLWLAVASVLVAYWFFRSPLLDAVADAIRRGAGYRYPILGQLRALAQVTEEMRDLREHVSEFTERLDFAERALAEVRRRDLLQQPRT